MNKINNKTIENSIQMKDKWLRSIFKKSRKLSSLDKFWNLVIEELGYFYFKDLKYLDIYISEKFLMQLKEHDKSFNNEEEYMKFSPKTFTGITEDDFSIYITKRIGRE